MLATMPAQATRARIQLGHWPSAPFVRWALVPPPSSWNVSFERGERLALLAAEAEDQAPPDEEAAEGDDEGRDPAVGDDEPGDGAARAAPSATPNTMAMSQTSAVPCRLLGVDVEAEERQDAVGLDEGHREAEEAEQRADRQVDVARHDDQHHAGGHDGDRRALDRQVPQVAGGEEVAVGQDVEADPDGPEGDQHAEQPGVDLERATSTAGRSRACATAPPPPSSRVAGGTPVRTMAGASSGESGSLDPSTPLPARRLPAHSSSRPPGRGCSRYDVPPVRRPRTGGTPESYRSLCPTSDGLMGRVSRRPTPNRPRRPCTRSPSWSSRRRSRR